MMLLFLICSAIIVIGDFMQKRIEWLDMAKGWGILLIIFGHMGTFICPVTYYPHIVIYSFHIPLFFFLSGYLFSVGKGFGDFLKKKLRTIVLPYFFFAAVLLLYNMYEAKRLGKFTVPWLLENCRKILIQDRYWTIWFLAAVFSMNLLMYLIVRLTRGKELFVALAAVVCAAGGLLYYHLGGTALPWDIDIAFASMPFFAGGWLMCRHSDKIDSLLSSKLRIIILFIPCIAITIVLGRLNFKLSHKAVDICACNYGNIPVFFIAAFAGILATVLFSRLFTLRFISYVGRNSVIYFALHQIIVLPQTTVILTNLGYTIQGGDPAPKMLLYWLIQFVLTLLILTAVSVVFNNTPLKYLIGRKRPAKEQPKATQQDTSPER